MNFHNTGSKILHMLDYVYLMLNFVATSWIVYLTINCALVAEGYIFWLIPAAMILSYFIDDFGSGLFCWLGDRSGSADTTFWLARLF